MHHTDAHWPTHQYRPSYLLFGDVGDARIMVQDAIWYEATKELHYISYWLSIEHTFASRSTTFRGVN